MPRVDTSKHGGGAGGGGVFLCGCGYHLRGLERGLELEFLPLRRKPYCFLELVPSRKPCEDATRRWRLHLPAAVG